MTFSNKRKGKRLLKRYVFRKSKSQKPRSLIRLCVECCLMFFSATALLLFLNTLPRRYDFQEMFVQISSDFIDGLVQVFDSLILLVSLALIYSLVVLALVLLLGSFWRFLRILSIYLAKVDKYRRISNR